MRKCTEQVPERCPAYFCLSPTVVAPWTAGIGSTASHHTIAWRRALGASVSTAVVGRLWPAAFPPEHGKPADLDI